MIKTRWLIYTVIIGLIPFIVRLLVYAFLNEKNIDFLMSEADFIVFGMVLNLSNLNELEHAKLPNELWKTQMIGISVIQIIIYSGFLGIALLDEINVKEFNFDMIFFATVVSALSSLAFSYSIFNKLNELESNG